jgi:hypothetical protein
VLKWPEVACLACLTLCRHFYSEYKKHDTMSNVLVLGGLHSGNKTFRWLSYIYSNVSVIW